MAMFQMVLIAMTAVIALFTVTAVAQGGPNLLTPFFKPILAMTWQGQFHIDFVTYLVLSGIWMAWRSGFSRGGLVLGVCAPPLGILFLAPYLLYLCAKHRNDPRALLLGVRA